MLKKVLCFLLLTALLLSLSACNTEEKKEKKTEELLKELLAKIDEGSFDENGLTIELKQKYTLSSQRDNQDEKSDFSMSYEGEGSFTLLAELPGGEKVKEKDGKLDYYDLLSRGSGYIKNNQAEHFSVKGERLDKAEGENESVNEAYSITHQVAIKFDETDYYASNQTDFRNPLDPSFNKAESFAGRIAKASLLETLSPKTVELFMEELIYMEGYSLLGDIHDYSASYFLQDPLFDSSNLREFIRENGVSATENKGRIIVAFSADARRISEKMNQIILPEETRISGTMEFDKESGELLNFSYDLKEFMTRQIQVVGQESGGAAVDMEYFTIRGEVIKTPPAQMPLEGEFEQFSDAGLFIEQFAAQATPMDD